MAAIQSIIVASVLLLVIFVGQGSTIKCFDCNSNDDIRCALAYPPSEFITDCSELTTTTKLTYTFFRKISQIITLAINELDSDNRVIRACGSNITEVKSDCYRRHGRSAHLEVCECDISYCNGIDRVSKSATVLLFSILLAILKLFVA